LTRRRQDSLLGDPRPERLSPGCALDHAQLVVREGYDDFVAFELRRRFPRASESAHHREKQVSTNDYLFSSEK